MSAYSETATEFNDGELLLKALEEMGYKPQNCIGNPQPLVGYQGDFRAADGNGHTRNTDQAMRADIIIPRKQVGIASNDLGFVKGADGKFRAIISAYDSTMHNQQWLNKVKARYADAGILKQARKAGLKLAKRTVVKGQIQYEFLRG